MPLDKKYVETLGVVEVRSYYCDDDSIKEKMDMLEFQASRPSSRSNFDRRDQKIYNGEEGTFQASSVVTQPILSATSSGRGPVKTNPRV